MNRKFLSLVCAAVLLVSASVTALAAPDEAPTPAPSASPESTAPASASPFLAQVKAMREEVAALRKDLADERQYDRQMREDIRSLQGIVMVDKQEFESYKAQLKALQDQWKNAKKADKPAIKQQIRDLKAKYKALLDQIKDNALGRRSLKPLRQQIQPLYAQLAPLYQDSKSLTKDIDSLVQQLKTAIQSNDEQTAQSLLDQITAKIGQLKDDLNQRIAIRKQISSILDDFKANFKPITIQ